MNNALSINPTETGGFILHQAKLPQSKLIPFPLPQSLPEIALGIDMPAFHIGFSLPIIDFAQAVDSGSVMIKCAIDNQILVVINLLGKLLPGNDKYEINEVLLSVQLTEQQARADFISSTLLAMLGLGEEVFLRIPEIHLKLRFNFISQPASISQLLQRRQIAYRLMVIERATACHFLLPKHISGSEVENIAFAYHAIIKGTFYWPLKTVQIFAPATAEGGFDLPLSDQPTTYALPQRKASRYILGKSIELGYEQVTIEDGLVLDVDKVRLELAKNDGHLVEITLVSLSDRAKYEITGAPQLPAIPWEKNIQSLIKVEPELDSRLASMYHELASAAFSGLSDKQIAGVTVRPQIDDNSFRLPAE